MIKEEQLPQKKRRYSLKKTPSRYCSVSIKEISEGTFITEKDITETLIYMFEKDKTWNVSLIEKSTKSIHEHSDHSIW